MRSLKLRCPDDVIRLLVDGCMQSRVQAFLRIPLVLVRKKNAVFYSVTTINDTKKNFLILKYNFDENKNAGKKRGGQKFSTRVF